ncbi:efflux RND transporter permease subunit [Halobacterium sp. KA-6]|uniref:efflux RND transporter permease subunit n=1 Tax=Halobacterium sp. KA-6 TaxID=2896368 RepID=UPI001E5E0D14|nr:MMPL family transporter [Halobacterium sp. KA-6]MCD2205036.1 MMPL family transporter [Halobacterium sp. KA-6]
MVTVDSLLETADDWIVDRPKAVVVAFLVLTLVFAGGLGGISSDAGTSQFVEGNPAQEAYEDVNAEFGGSPFAADVGSTQIIQRGDNVLSKPALLRSLTLQERVQERESLRVSGTSSAATIVAQTLDPTATTVTAQQRAIRDATPAQIDAAVKQAAQTPGFTALLSTDFNKNEASSSATIGTIQHRVPAGLSSTAGAGGTSPLTPMQLTVEQIADRTQGDFTVFGSGILSNELNSVIGDSMAIVVPAAALLIIVFLVFAYRDPVDLLLGIIALVMTIIWTFGFMGLAGIPFSQMLIAVPVLLLAVGIDFGIHTVNRYREERATGAGIHAAMRPTTDQLLVAFFIVTGTTVIGFSANMISDLGPIRDLGLVAGIGIVFTFLIFGVFLPSMKVLLDEARIRLGIPEFGSTAIGSGNSLLARSLTVGNWCAKRGPKAFLALMLVSGAVAGAYGTGVDTSFSNEDFLPPEESPDYIEALPEPFAPGDYTVTETLNFLEENFESAQSSSVTIYIEAPLRQDDALQQIHRVNKEPPEALISEDRRAHPESIVSVIESRTSQDPEFAQLVARNDRNGDGIPDNNLKVVYDYLLSSSSRGQTLNYLSENYRSTRVVYSAESDATQDEVAAAGREMASRYRMHAIATGQTVVFAAITDVIFNSAIQSLILALIATAIFLVLIYWVLERRPSLGIVNLIPLVWTIAVLAGTMRYFGIPLNVLTATILSIAIGLGIDYSAHIVHRFADEYDPSRDIHDALDKTVRGTGGALAGSMLTTSSGTGVLALAITPILGQFGLVIALSVFLSFIASILITPSAAVLWERVVITQPADQPE